MDALTLLRIQAHASRLANLRLHTALAALPAAELAAPRTGFFPGLMATLNHILSVDLYYVGALHDDADLLGGWSRFVPAPDLAVLADRQSRCDLRLLAWLQALPAAGLQRRIDLPRGAGRVQQEAAAHVLQHLFMHQTHHRGQAHHMLSGTALAPPQLDEFLMPSEAHLRSAEMAAMGWHEAQVYGPLP